MAGKSSTPHLKPLRDEEKLDAVIEAISEYDLASSPAWDDLDILSNRTQVDAIEANPEGIFDEGKGHFQATGSIYVILNYGDKRDGLSSTDSFPIHVAGHFDKAGRALIDTFEVDTSAFFGDEQATDHEQSQ